MKIYEFGDKKNPVLLLLPIPEKRFEQKMASADPYNKAFVAITGRDK